MVDSDKTNELHTNTSALAIEFERCLIEHCAPTLASLKTANLFVLPYENTDELFEQVNTWNELLSEKGVLVELLRLHTGKALIYVYRRDRLEEDLRGCGVAEFLIKCGYSGTTADEALATLTEKLRGSSDFPHEIGIFLGYPLGDVIGFVRNGGKHCKCTGYWKVYCNRCDAERTFCRYDKCRSIYCQRWREGVSVQKLTVSAACFFTPRHALSAKAELC